MMRLSIRTARSTADTAPRVKPTNGKHAVCMPH